MHVGGEREREGGMEGWRGCDPFWSGVKEGQKDEKEIRERGCKNRARKKR